jgi:hypothetical protein
MSDSTTNTRKQVLLKKATQLEKDADGLVERGKAGRFEMMLRQQASGYRREAGMSLKDMKDNPVTL